MWIDPIFDRTEADVAYARLHRDAQPPLKGAISAPDWARITGNVHHLADLLASYGTNITVNCVTAWARTDFPTHTKVLTIYSDIERLQEGFARYAHCPLLSWNHWEKINHIERILYELHAMLERMAAVFPRAGNMVYGGSYFYIKNGGGT